jgi:hypothetical protein
LLHIGILNTPGAKSPWDPLDRRLGGPRAGLDAMENRYLRIIMATAFLLSIEDTIEKEDVLLPTHSTHRQVLQCDVVSERSVLCSLMEQSLLVAAKEKKCILLHQGCNMWHQFSLVATPSRISCIHTDTLYSLYNTS